MLGGGSHYRKILSKFDEIRLQDFISYGYTIIVAWPVLGTFANKRKNYGEN